MLVASGCGNPDSPTGLEWTSTPPAFSSDVVEPPGQVSDPTQPAPEESLAEPVAISTITTTTAVATVVSAQPPVTTTAPASAVGGLATGEEPAAVTSTVTSGPADEKELAPPNTVPADNFSLDVPDIGVPAVQDPERIQYAAQQVQKIYFKWFDAIYRKDPDTLWESVATAGGYESGIAAMDRMTFTAPPTLEGVRVEVLEPHIDHTECLVASFEMDISAFRETSGLVKKVMVMWPDPQYGWRRNITFGLPTVHGIWWGNCFTMERPAFP